MTKSLGKIVAFHDDYGRYDSGLLITFDFPKKLRVTTRSIRILNNRNSLGVFSSAFVGVPPLVS